jgi:hypothetical protein
MIYETFIEARASFAAEIRFLARAVSHDKTRCWLNNIHIEPSEKEEGAFLGVATDGKRMHIVDPLSCPDGTGLAPGAWRCLKAKRETAWIVKIAEKDAGQFPPWRRVIPDAEPVYTAKFYGLPLGKKDARPGTGFSALVKFIREFPEPTVINLAYLAGLGTDHEWDVRYTENTGALVFEAVNRKAVVMPILPG